MKNKIIVNNEDELQMCDKTICEIADKLEPRSYTSREFIYEIGKYLKNNAKKKDSLIETAYDNNVPIFCPAFTDSSAGFGLVMHQEKNPKKHITIDSVREFRELTEIKISLGISLFLKYAIAFFRYSGIMYNIQRYPHNYHNLIKR